MLRYALVEVTAPDANMAARSVLITKPGAAQVDRTCRSARLGGAPEMVNPALVPLDVEVSFDQTDRGWVHH